MAVASHLELQGKLGTITKQYEVLILWNFSPGQGCSPKQFTNRNGSWASTLLLQKLQANLLLWMILEIMSPFSAHISGVKIMLTDRQNWLAGSYCFFDTTLTSECGCSDHRTCGLYSDARSPLVMLFPICISSHHPEKQPSWGVRVSPKAQCRGLDSRSFRSSSRQT